MTVSRHPNNQGVFLSQWRYTATGGETTLSGTDGFATALAYTVGAEQLFVNGVLLERGVDYLATTGTTVTGLTALVAGDIVTVSSPSSFSVANAIPLSTVTAKGDLLAATGSGTVTNLAVGADGTTLVANSASATGVAWTAGNPIPNPVINSAFQIAQRGTSISAPAAANTYTLDRWIASTGVSAAATISRQATSDTTNLPFIQYCARVQRNSGQTGTVIWFLQSFETINSIPYAGKTITVSFYARAGANYSMASSVLNLRLISGTGTDQNYATGYTGAAFVIDQNATLTTTWQRFQFTGTVSASATELTTLFNFVATGTAGTNDYYEITGVQVDVSPVALPFRTNAPTLQGELAACQRYYSVGQSIGIVNATVDGGGNYRSYPQNFLPVTMRTTPTIGITSYTAGTVNKVTSNIFFSVYGGSAADSTSAASAVTITNNSFTLSGVNSTNGKYDGANWTATAEL